MPERRKAVFEHCFIHELSYKETAEVLSISPKTVENHMALAFKDMRASLEKFQKK
jgi:RNA polymerase sigma-70 factor (ECF subfamily)